jgi:DNA-binding transcriptional MerR regulator
MTARNVWTSGDVARRVHLQRSRFLYLIEAGRLPGPSSQVAGRRLYTEDDIQQIEAVLNEHPKLRQSGRTTSTK